MTPKQEWKLLYSFARKTKDINPNLKRDVLSGPCRPCGYLMSMVVPFMNGMLQEKK